MTADHLKGLEECEAELWKIADNLHANSNLASNEYFMPVMGLLFLRQATNRYYAALEAIEADKKAGRMAKRPPAPSSAQQRIVMSRVHQERPWSSSNVRTTGRNGSRSRAVENCSARKAGEARQGHSTEARSAERSVPVPAVDRRQELRAAT